MSTLIYIESIGFAVIVLNLVVGVWALKKIEYKYTDAHSEIGRYWP